LNSFYRFDSSYSVDHIFIHNKVFKKSRPNLNPGPTPKTHTPPLQLYEMRKQALSFAAKDIEDG
jgi:hypothetical protein